MENFAEQGQEKMKQLEEAGLDLEKNIIDRNTLETALFHAVDDIDVAQTGYDPEDIKLNRQKYEKELEDLNQTVEKKSTHFYDLMRQVISPSTLTAYENRVQSSDETLGRRMERVVASGRDRWEKFLEDPNAFVERL